LHSHWKRRAEDTFDAYRAKMPMRKIMERVLDCTVFGINSSRPKSMSAERGTDISAHESKTSIKINMGGKFGDPPVLIGSVGDYNMVYFREKYIGLRQSLGPIDLQQYDLRDLPPPVYILDSRDELESELARVALQNPV
jgi:hypothetical protein